MVFIDVENVHNKIKAFTDKIERLRRVEILKKFLIVK